MKVVNKSLLSFNIMNEEQFEQQAKEAAKAFGSKKKQPTRPETQFQKGAMWAWSLLMDAKEWTWYQDRLTADVMDREGEVPAWKESLIIELAKMLAEKESMEAEIRKTGRLVTKIDKNFHEYKESNPLYVHVKAKDQSISVWRDKLGLSNTVNPERIKADSKKGVEDDNPFVSFLKGKKS